MNNDLVLDISRDETKVKVSVYERGEKGERTLRQYEDSHAAWEQIEVGRREITNLLNRANKRARVTADILDNLKKTGHVLFDLLIPPKAREKLGSTTATNLILYVDDKLVHIPWELLFDGREFLCRRFAMGRIVSTRQAPTALSSRSLNTPFRVLVLADPRGDLKASYQEGIEIRDFLDERRDSFQVNFKSDPIDVRYVKKNLRDYDIVHYAGHADYHPQNPSESGWLLKDGRLKASDISAMGGLAPMPALVFSNACQTGQTDEWRIQEGYEQQIFGLANAYLLAGVQHYIGTFWEILDEPSGFFAKRFYSFLTQGVKLGEAVRRARQELIDAYGEETIVWATYMLYGDPTFEISIIDPQATLAIAPDVKAQARVKPRDPFIGRLVKGRYQVIKKLGGGGMGSVYLAEQISIRRKVALKILDRAYAQDDELVKRFRREAHLAATLAHQNVVAIHDFDQAEDGSLFIAMEFIEGRSLRDLIQDGPMDLEKALRLGIQIGDGLAAAHRKGVIHRDIKPENIMTTKGEEEIKLMDFGISRLNETTAATRLTREGAIIGTPAYMAPEQIQGGQVTERTDIYAFGIVLYEMFTGDAPFKASNPTALLIKHLEAAPVPLRQMRAEVPPIAAQLVMQALEKDPQKRPQSVEQLIHGLREATAAFGHSSRPASVSEVMRSEMNQVRSGETAAPISEVKSGRPPWLYPSLGALVAVLAFFGYQQFYPASVQEEVSVSTPATPVPVAREADTKMAAVEKAELKAPVVMTEASKAQVSAKPTTETPAPVAKSKVLQPPPVVKTQESAPPAEGKQEVAVAKESAPPAVAAPLSLKMNIIGQRKEADGSYSEILVSEGSVLRSRDNFQVHLEPSRPAYVYILMYDSQGKASQIFPDPKIDKPGFVDGGRNLVVPGRELWFWLDDSTGTETIYVLASEKPMADIRGLLAKMEGGDDAGQQLASRQIKERIAVLQRGVGGITKGTVVTYTLSDGKKIQKVTDVVSGTGSVVRAVSFLHR